MIPPKVINIRDAPATWKNNPMYVYIGRYHCSEKYGTIRESKWHNPFKGERIGSIIKFRAYLLQNGELLNSLSELDGKTLVCWCKPKLCHGDILAYEFAEMMTD